MRPDVAAAGVRSNWVAANQAMGVWGLSEGSGPGAGAEAPRETRVTVHRLLDISYYGRVANRNRLRKTSSDLARVSGGKGAGAGGGIMYHYGVRVGLEIMCGAAQASGWRARWSTGTPRRQTRVWKYEHLPPWPRSRSLDVTRYRSEGDTGTSYRHGLGGQIPAHSAVRVLVRVNEALRPMIPFHFDAVACGARNRISSDELSSIMSCRGLDERNRCVIDSSRSRAFRSSTVAAATTTGPLRVYRLHLIALGDDHLTRSSATAAG